MTSATPVMLSANIEFKTHCPGRTGIKFGVDVLV